MPRLQLQVAGLVAVSLACAASVAADGSVPTNTPDTKRVPTPWVCNNATGIKSRTVQLNRADKPVAVFRTETAHCDPVTCVVYTSKDDPGPYSPCGEEVDGRWYKYKTVGIQTPALFGGTCPSDAARLLKELCQPVACVIATPTEDAGSFGACQLGTGGWYQSKTLRIQTPALYGGSCPVETDARRQYQQLCPPVACVINTAADAVDVFGPCQQEATGWYKTVTYSVKTPALYGGTCPSEAARQVKELCPAVACVVNTVADDTGAFGPCQMEATDWYKYKTLGIKTEPLYGGTACPTVDARRYKEVCVRACSPITPGLDISGDNVFGIATVASSAACCDKCRSTVRCRSYVFYTNDNTCVTWSAITGTYSSTIAIAGTVNFA